MGSMIRQSIVEQKLCNKNSFKNFLCGNTESISEGLYDTRDLERLEIEDAVVSCYLKHQKGSLERTVGMINTSLKWRKEIGVNGELKL